MEKKATCRECKAEKLIDEFYVTPQGKVIPWCKVCQKKRRSANYCRYKSEGRITEEHTDSFMLGELVCY